MIVRLKAARQLIRYTHGEFQFYDSPIKRRVCARQQRKKNWFQFYDSPIKSFRCAHLHAP